MRNESKIKDDFFSKTDLYFRLHQNYSEDQQIKQSLCSFKTYKSVLNPIHCVKIQFRNKLNLLPCIRCIIAFRTKGSITIDLGENIVRTGNNAWWTLTLIAHFTRCSIRSYWKTLWTQTSRNKAENVIRYVKNFRKREETSSLG